MISKWLKHELAVFVLALVFSSGLFVFRLGSYLGLEWTLWKKEKILQKAGGPLVPPKAVKPISDESIQGVIEEVAKSSRIKRVLNIGSSSQMNDQHIDLEWEGSLSSSFQFLEKLANQGRLGRCEKLHIALGDASLIHVGGSFEQGAKVVQSTFSTPVLLSSSRNVFIPLWESRKEDPVILESQVLKKQEEVRQKEQQKTDEENKKRVETERLEAKRREIETGLTLTGIVNNGHEPLAFINTRSGGGQTLMLHSGDVVQEAQITSIDEKNGEIQLDYQGKFQVHLKISRSSGSLQ